MFYKLLFLCISFVYINAQNTLTQKEMFVVVSDRSSSSLNTAAKYYMKNSVKNIKIRSVSQVLQMSLDELNSYVNKADIILYTSVFGEIIEKLNTLNYRKNQMVISLQGDRRLLKINQDPFLTPYKNFPLKLLNKTNSTVSYLEYLNKKQEDFPSFSFYLQARAYWENRGIENISNLFSFLFTSNLSKNEWPKIKELKQIRYFLNANASKTYDKIDDIILDRNKDILFVLDNDRADSTSSWQIHETIQKHAPSLQVVSVLSSWGKASYLALKNVQNLLKKSGEGKHYSIISLHDFVIGGGESRLDVNESLKKLNVPILKALRVLDSTSYAYKLSSSGLAVNSVHYRISMPELQGIGQVHILAMSEGSSKDEKTGLLLLKIKVLDDEVKNIVKKSKRWISLKKQENKNKKIAIIYYNHPPGRHNIGADNLNVPATLFEILNNLKKEGYEVGVLPKSSEALLSLLQEKAVNLPNDKTVLKKQNLEGNNVTSKEYAAYLDTLPIHIKEEMKFGPLAALHAQIKEFLYTEIQIVSNSDKLKAYKAMNNYMNKTMNNLHHALDGVRNKSRKRALNLLLQLKNEYTSLLQKSQDENKINLTSANALNQAIIDLEIEGIRGWGEVPGEVMVYNNELLIPSVEFGNIILAPQPPRGWELNEELLHANLSFPPTHQYMAFYYYMKNKFKADAIIHLGRHSTYEFLPRKAVGLSASDYPRILIDDLPSIYPYIVDGVGEGIQAKRRGHAIMIDHLTPPIATTDLYDSLLELRQLIESAEAASDDNLRKNAILKIKEAIDTMHLREELEASMDEELKVRGIAFNEIDDEFLLHEVGHYLTHLQEEFMPLGLHTFGKNWKDEAVAIMLKSMKEEKNEKVKENLIISPKKEMQALFSALNGGYTEAGKGNDPIRTPDSLPTGRNFYALDAGLIPSKIAVDIAGILAQKIRSNKKSDVRKKEALILWASDTVRDEGAMIALGLDLLGIKAIWNKRGILKGLERKPLDEKRKYRRDVLFTASGLFRDLYASKLLLLNKAVLMALDASSFTIIDKYPALSLSLNTALSSLGELKKGGNESLDVNIVALNWVKEAREMLKNNKKLSLEEVGLRASYRVFATAPGSYGAGINRLVERSNSWKTRKELGDVFIKRVSYVYSSKDEGILAKDTYVRQLQNVGNTYLGRASNLYGLIDNNDTFDYLGGLNLAIETLTGKHANSYVIDHSNAKDLKIKTLQSTILGELRGRYLNPQWIKPLMKEGYSGARTMGSEFIEYLWGWQVTNPEIIDTWVWDEVKAVYIDDKLNLDLDKFLSSDYNVHVQTNILAVMLVAIQKDFWKADEKTIKDLANKFTENIIKYGIPGSGHTQANHEIYNFIKPYISSESLAKLQKVLDKSKVDKKSAKNEQYQSIQEIKINEQEIKNEEKQELKENNVQDKPYIMYLLFVFLFLLFAGIFKSVFFNKGL